MRSIGFFAALIFALVAPQVARATNGASPVLSPAAGGTGSATASGARANLGAAASGANADITSLSGMTTPLSAGQGGTGSTLGVGGTPFAATNGSASQSQAAREGQRLSVREFANVYADTKASTVAATVNSGTPITLNVASGIFSSGDVGKFIVIPFAGSQISWLGGSITSIPVATNGVGYTAMPSVSFSGGGGSGALAQPLLQVSGVAANVTGTGCTTGTYATTVAGGKFNTAAAVLSVTIAAGSVSAASVATVGDYFSLPTLTGNAPGTIPGCSVQPTFNLTFNLGSVYVQWGGSGYSLSAGAVTATLSGGSPGTAATLGTVVASPFVAPLATTISAYVSPTQVTLASGASSFLSAQSVRVVWGHDDCAGINAAIASLPSGSALRFPYGNYGCASSPMLLTNKAIKIEGDGPENSVVYALAPMTSLLDKNSSYTIGGTIRDMMFDGNRLTQFTCYIQSLYQAVIENTYCLNAATPTAFGSSYYSANLSAGDGTGVVEQVEFTGDYLRNDSGLYVGSGDFPTYGVWARSSDDYFTNNVEVNNTEANFRVETSAPDTWITNNHAWGSGATSLALADAAQNCLEIAASAWATEPGCDVARGDGVYVGASTVHVFGGHLYTSQVYTTTALSGAYGLEIAGGLSNISTFGFDAGNNLSGSSRFHESTPYPTTSQIWGGTGVGQQAVDLGQQNTTSTANGYGVCAGSYNKCNGTNSFVAGQNNTGGSLASTVLGNRTNDFGVQGVITNGYGGFSSVVGSAESFDLTLVAQTTNGTTGVPLLDGGSSAGNYNQIPVPSISGQANSLTACRLFLTGTNSASGASSSWTSDNALFKNVGGTVSQVGSNTWSLQAQDSAASTWTTPILTADTSHLMITQTITGVASTNINWVERAHCVIN